MRWRPDSFLESIDKASRRNPCCLESSRRLPKTLTRSQRRCPPSRRLPHPHRVLPSATVNEERLRSPEQFAGELANHLAAFAETASPLPSDAELAALVEAAFFAS